MKLLYCSTCGDIVVLRKYPRNCECNKISGYFEENGLTAVITGGIPLGFVNYSFVTALMCRPDSGKGKEFKAFVIPKNCITIKEKKP